MSATSILSRGAAAVVAIVHFIFVLFALFGALLVVHDPAWMWLHLPTVAWSVGIFALGRECPLTPLEKSLLQRAGGPVYAGGFVEHYLLRRPPGAPLDGGGQTRIAFGIATWTAALYALGFMLAT